MTREKIILEVMSRINPTPAAQVEAAADAILSLFAAERAAAEEMEKALKLAEDFIRDHEDRHGSSLYSEDTLHKTCLALAAYQSSRGVK